MAPKKESLELTLPEWMDQTSRPTFHLPLHKSKPEKVTKVRNGTQGVSEGTHPSIPGHLLPGSQGGTTYSRGLFTGPEFFIFFSQHRTALVGRVFGFSRFGFSLFAPKRWRSPRSRTGGRDRSPGASLRSAWRHEALKPRQWMAQKGRPNMRLRGRL